MEVVPTFTGETIPVPAVMVATVGVELVQVPPPSELVRVIVVPVQTLEDPEITGTAFTVTTLVA